MIIFFDTETTGKLDFRAPAEAPQQPDLVQLAACLMDDEAERVFGQINFIILPNGFTIPSEVAAIHGISQEIALEVGQPRRTALSAFNHMCRCAKDLVAYNVDFDYAVMLTAYHREGVRHRMDSLTRLCAMRRATPIVKLPKPKGWRPRPGDEYKWPTLTEAHSHFFGHGFDGAHNAMNDVTALVAVWRQIRQAESL
jgi:DNA polymerase-3 subunit epsilon